MGAQEAHRAVPDQLHVSARMLKSISSWALVVPRTSCVLLSQIFHGEYHSMSQCVLGCQSGIPVSSNPQLSCVFLLMYAQFTHRFYLQSRANWLTLNAGRMTTHLDIMMRPVLTKVAGKAYWLFKANTVRWKALRAAWVWTCSWLTQMTPLTTRFAFAHFCSPTSTGTLSSWNQLSRVSFYRCNDLYKF